MSNSTSVFDGKGILENYMQSANNFMNAVLGYKQNELANRTQDNYEAITRQNERKLRDDLETSKLNRDVLKFGIVTGLSKGLTDMYSTEQVKHDAYLKAGQNLQSLAAKARTGQLTPDEKNRFKAELDVVESYKSTSGKSNIMFDAFNSLTKNFNNYFAERHNMPRFEEAVKPKTNASIFDNLLIEAKTKGWY